MSYTAEKTRTLYFCACKHTKGAPLCDGSHNALANAVLAKLLNSGSAMHAVH